MKEKTQEIRDEPNALGWGARKDVEGAGKKDLRIRINYNWIVQHLPFVLFLSLLALLYIANGHYAVRNIRDINRISHDVKELHWQYLDVKTSLMFRSKLNEVSQGVMPMGIQPSATPPITIESVKEK